MHAKDFLMIPGPTPVPDEVLEAIGRHPIGHRTNDFSIMLREVMDELKWLGETKNDVLVLTSSGTGAMEAAIANTISPGDRVLSLVCGVFSERWAKIAEAFGAQVERLKAEPGKAISVEAVRDYLAQGKNKDIKAVTIAHNETSTGVINDLQLILDAVKQHGALSIVDAVTSYGAIELPIDKWGADVVITGSQKALMIPPGLAFVFVSPKAWEVHAKCKTHRFYFDFARGRKSADADTTPFTANVSLVAGLQVALRMMHEEGKEKIFARHLQLKSMVRQGIKELGLKPLANDSCASPTITAILPPNGTTADTIRKTMKERYRILLAAGQDELEGKIFRIGHMGYVFERDILMTMASLRNVLQELGHEQKTLPVGMRSL